LNYIRRCAACPRAGYASAVLAQSSYRNSAVAWAVLADRVSDVRAAGPGVAPRADLPGPARSLGVFRVPDGDHSCRGGHFSTISVIHASPRLTPIRFRRSLSLLTWGICPIAPWPGLTVRRATLILSAGSAAKNRASHALVLDDSSPFLTLRSRLPGPRSRGA